MRNAHQHNWQQKGFNKALRAVVLEAAVLEQGFMGLAINPRPYDMSGSFPKGIDTVV